MKPKTNRFLPFALFTLLGAANHAQAQSIYQWNGTSSTDWATAGNWTGQGLVGGTYNARLNVYNGTGQKLIYSATQGTTVYASSARGLVISAATNAVAGSMEITGGSFSTLGSASGDIIGNAATGTLTVSGGSFTGTAAGTILGLNSGSGTSTLTVSGSLNNPGSATLSTLQMSAATAIVNLNTYGTLTVNQIVDVDNSGATGNSNTTFNFNGGTLKAGSGAVTDFMGLSGSSNALTNAYVKSGGAKIDTNGKSITISQALLDGTGGGGLTLDDTAVTKGTLTLTNTNTYTGATTISTGTLKVSGSIGSSDVTVNGGILASGSTGAVGKNVTVGTGAKFAAGDVGTVGAATVANDLNFSSGSIFDWDLTTGAGNGTYDTVSVTGTLAITSGAKFNVVSSTVFSDPFWNTTHTWSNIFGGKAIDNFLVSNFQYNGSATAPSAEGSFSISGASLNWTAVPEPTSALAGLLLTVGLLQRRRQALVAGVSVTQRE